MGHYKNLNADFECSGNFGCAVCLLIVSRLGIFNERVIMKKIFNTVIASLLAFVLIIPVNAEGEENEDFSQVEERILEINEIGLQSSNIIAERIDYKEDYAVAQSVEKRNIAGNVDQYTINLSTYAYDPIGSTFQQGLYNAQFIVFVENRYASNLTFRKPVYYTQKITWFDSGLGNPATMTSNATFYGTWGPVGDPQDTGYVEPSALTTSGTSLGTRYTGANKYFVVSLTNSCTFKISTVWNVKQSGQKILNSNFWLW